MPEHPLAGLSIKDLFKEPPSPNSTLLALAGIAPDLDDRSFAILECSKLENSLDLLITQSLDHLSNRQRNGLFESRDAPLKTFAAKIRIAHAMRLFGNNTFTDLMSIKEVRNVFAHSKADIDFQTPAIEKECEKLRGTDTTEPTLWNLEKGLTKTTRARSKYSGTCYCLSNSMLDVAFPGGLRQLDRFSGPTLPLD